MIANLKAKLFNKERFKEKIRMKKLMNAVEEKEVDKSVEVKDGARPAYLLDRE